MLYRLHEGDGKAVYLIGVDDNLEDAYQDFKKILRKYPTDERLQKLFNVFSQFKRQYRSHVTRRYGR